MLFIRNCGWKEGGHHKRRSESSAGKKSRKRIRRRIDLLERNWLNENRALHGYWACFTVQWTSPVYIWHVIENHCNWDFCGLIYVMAYRSCGIYNNAGDEMKIRTRYERDNTKNASNEEKRGLDRTCAWPWRARHVYLSIPRRVAYKSVLMSFRLGR